MSLIKKPYELSVWKEEFLKDGSKYESKGAIIGGDTMSYLGKATNIVLKREIKGTNTLTFQMPTKFFDSEKGDYVKNEFIDELYNERKIKLEYDGTWYEFYIKKIQEDKKFKAIMKQFTCEDSFIDELSRTGYEVEFDETLNNSVEESGVFMIDILENSVWDYTPQYNIGDFTEFNEERFYKIPLSLFGGSISAYPLNLVVQNEDFNVESDYYKKVVKEKGKFNFGEENLITNPIKDESRKMEYGDDLARVKELFWDNYYKDNGRALLSSNNKKNLSGDYIYVPVSDLSPIQGSIFTSATKAVEEPAFYGTYLENNSIYALQPTSTNPTDLIQFMFFEDGDSVMIDEVNVISDNRYHYVIPIEEWNALLKIKLGNKKGLIHWITPALSDDVDIKYIVHHDNINNVYYTVNVTPQSSTIDNFYWYPVYSEGYLTEIGGKEVAEARKISVTDRTELNLGTVVTDDLDSSQSKESAYVTVYNNRSSEFNELYDNTEDFPIEDNDEYRVVSKLQTRQILPTLADNLITNGTEISDTNGWEARIQNNNDDSLGDGFASYTKLMELEVKTTVNNKDTSGNIDVTSESYLPTGDEEDKSVSDYYLEILSPYIDICSDLSVEGSTQVDYCLNFGLSSNDKKIEKGKIYAIRIKTGNWFTNQYTYHFYNIENSESDSADLTDFVSKDSKISEKNGIIITDTSIQKAIDEDYETLKKEISKYRLGLVSWGVKINEELEADLEVAKAATSKKTITKTYYEIKADTESGITLTWNNEALWSGFSKYLKKQVFTLPALEADMKKFNWTAFVSCNISYDGEITDEFLTSSDIKYAMAACANTDTYTSLWSASDIITDDMVATLLSGFTSQNQLFSMSYNNDLDKIVIGEGSVNLNGNYILSGTENDDNADNFISFKDLFEKINTSDLLKFIPDRNVIENKDDSSFLTQPLYRKITSTSETIVECDDGTIDTKKSITWGWSENSETNSIEDNTFLLFKAKSTIENPYVGIKVESGPVEAKFKNVYLEGYSDIERQGIKIEPIVPLSSYTGTDGLIEEEAYELVSGMTIKIFQINADNFSSDYLSSIGYNEENGTIDPPSTSPIADRQVGELKDGDLLTSTAYQTLTTSATVPCMFNGVETGSDGKTRGYVLFVDDLYYGFFWLESTKEDSDDQQEDNEEGGEEE